MKIGDKVVCVNSRNCANCGIDSGLLKDSVYVISDVSTSCVNAAVVLKLIGLPTHKCHNRFDGILRDTWFNANRFRLLDEMKKEAGQIASKPVKATNA